MEIAGTDPGRYPVCVTATHTQVAAAAVAELPVYTRVPAGASAGLRETEWLLTNGLGGYAMGTALGVPTRRYHGLLIASMSPPVQREMMLHSLVETVVLEPGTERERSFELANYRFRGSGEDHPRGYEHCVKFEKGTFCRWTYRVGDAEIVKTLYLYRGKNAAAVEYAVRPGTGMVRLHVRPMVAMRDSHALLNKDHAAHEFRVEPSARQATVIRGERALALTTNRGAFDAESQWWYGFEYDVERERGYDYQEDLFSPGVFVLQMRGGVRESLTLTASIGGAPGSWTDDERQNRTRVQKLGVAALKGVRADAAGREAVAALAAVADDFVVRRGEGVSVIAGYPWFSDWGRDTMISLPGLFLATGRFEEARPVLETFAGARKNGLVPNVFNDRTGMAEYNTVDASLWFLHAACEYLRLSGDRAGFDGPIRAACLDIIEHYQRGTDFGIRMDPADGLIAAGDQHSQLTWMDAKRDGTVFTPRHGKAVEINALWHHGLMSVARAIEKDDPRKAAALKAIAVKAGTSFRAMFWNPTLRCCHDVLTPAARGAWKADSRSRPNQVFAASLEYSPLTPDQRAAVIRCVKKSLLTPVGLRTLDAADPGYKGRYEGTMWERDAAYHNGTVWPWLLGAYAEAVMRVGGFSPAAKAEARDALRPLIDTLDGWSMGQLPEVYDADGTAERPRRPGGCMAQAWSVAETLRVWLMAISG